MRLRPIAFALLFLAIASPLPAQEAVNNLAFLRDGNGAKVAPQSAWLDLRQTAGAYSTPQNAPAWVESVTLVPIPAREGAAARTIFRIRVVRPEASAQLLLLRLFFDDKPEQRPTITVWDESGTQVMRSNPMGAGIDLATSDSAILPMIGASAIDVEVPGDGKTVRGAFLDWMTSRTVAHPASAEAREFIPEPFAAAAPLQVPAQDTESFGTVTASLAPDVIRMGASVQNGASFQFGLESQPLLALLSFEVASARADSPPEVFLNGENLGPASLTLPDLADPAYQGEKARLIEPMRFHYTGWVRAQKLVPANTLRVGTNDLIIVAGPGTPVSAVRATQIQLKYLWDKSDYILQTGP